MSIESVAEELRVLHRRIHAQQANQHTWPTKEEELAADLDRYDRRLIKAASMLQVDVPKARGRDRFLLRDEERERLEQHLTGAGLDVRAPAGDQSQA